MRHWAGNEAFILKHLGAKKDERMTPAYVLKEAHRIDSAIRTQWDESFRNDDKLTYSQCICLAEHRKLARELWDKDCYSEREMQKLVDTAKSKARGAPPLRANSSGGGRGRGSGDKGGKDDKPRNRSGGRQPTIDICKGLMGQKYVKCLTARALLGGKVQKFCRGFNSATGCKRDKCDQRHNCDVLTSVRPPKHACDGNHSRQKHTGKCEAWAD